MDHLNAWRAVEAVMRTGSVSAAAQESGVTNAAVAAQIRRLEDRLGRTLFRRLPGGLEPVDALVDHAQTLSGAFAAIGAVQEDLHEQIRSRRVSLTVTTTFAETWLPHHLPDLYARVGAIDLRLDTTWQVVDLARSDVHFAIRFMADPDPGIEARPLMPSGVTPVCTPEFAERYDLHPGRRDLRGVPLVHIDVQTSYPDWHDWSGWSRCTGIALGPHTEAPQFVLEASGTRIARSGIGLVLGGLSDVLHAVASGQLVFPFGAEAVVPASYWHRIAWRQGRRFGPVQRQVRDWIIERAAQDRDLMKEVFGV